MAEALYGSMNHDGKIFEAGTLASKLPKKAREHARAIGFLVNEAPVQVEEVLVDVDEDEDVEVDDDEDETGTEE